MAAYENAAKNSMLDHLGTEITYAGLLNGSNVELSGGSPAYERKAVTWAAASGGTMAANGTLPVFDVPAATVNKVILMGASTAGVTYNIYDVTDEVFAAQGTYTITGITLGLNL
jgi:hypothetical protein